MSLWLNYPSVLIEKPFDVNPFEISDTVEQLNALMRLCVYVFLIMFLINDDRRYFVIPLIGLSAALYWNMTRPSEKFEPPKPIVAECTKPTVDNPHMNVTMADLLNTDSEGNIKPKPPACDYFAPGIAESVQKNFYTDTYRSTDDLFGSDVAQRQFYTMPCTDPLGDVQKFRDYLTKDQTNCKTNRFECYNYEDPHLATRAS